MIKRPLLDSKGRSALVTEDEFSRQLEAAWDSGYAAGYRDGDIDAEYVRDGSMGYRRGAEPVPAGNPYLKEG